MKAHERRENQRFSVHHRALLSTSQGRIKTFITEVSNEGFRIESISPIPNEKEIDISILLPGKNLVNVYGSVQWVLQINENGRILYQAGVKYWRPLVFNVEENIVSSVAGSPDVKMSHHISGETLVERLMDAARTKVA